MGKNRLEAFSDGVLAIVITIMVLELKVPHESDLASLRPLLPVFLSYVLSFLYIGIYWNNHHHMLHTTDRIRGGVLWANNHLLFWLSLFPFVTSWLGEHPYATIPTVAYGVVLLMAAIAYFILQNAIIQDQGSDGILAHAIGNDIKGKLSPLLYIFAIAAAFFFPFVSHFLFFAVAAMWLIPDSRIERTLQARHSNRTTH
jgi:uncharacterized membrane protein